MIDTLKWKLPCIFLPVWHYMVLEVKYHFPSIIIKQRCEFCGEYKIYETHVRHANVALVLRIASGDRSTRETAIPVILFLNPGTDMNDTSQIVHVHTWHARSFGENYYRGQQNSWPCKLYIDPDLVTETLHWPWPCDSKSTLTLTLWPKFYIGLGLVIHTLHWPWPCDANFTLTLTLWSQMSHACAMRFTTHLAFIILLLTGMSVY